MSRQLAFGLTCAAITWSAVILSLPFASDGGGVPLLSTLVYAAGSLVCHQRSERSFHAAGVALPVCARCTGLYLSAAIGALAAWRGVPAWPRRPRFLLATAAIPTAITLLAEASGIAVPSNGLRAAAAVPLGTAAGWLIVRMLRAESRRAHAL